MFLFSSFGRAFSLYFRTWPFVAIRFAVLLAFGVASLILFSLLFVGLTLIGVKNLVGLGFIFAFILLILFFGIFSWVKRYFLYLYDAGHVAVMAKMIKGEDKDIPGTMKQLDYGKDIVIKRIGSLTVLYVIESMVKGILHIVNSFAGTLISFMPKSIRDLLYFVMRVLNRAVFLVFDMVLSHLVFAPAKNAWMCAADTLVLYKKNMLRFLGLSALLVIFADVVSLVLVFFSYLAVFAVISLVIASNASALVSIIAIIAALIVTFTIVGLVRECILIPYSKAVVLCEFYETFTAAKITKEDYGILNNIPQFQELLKKAKENPKS